MRPLHRWPSFLLIFQMISLLFHETTATGSLQVKFWEWSPTVCCVNEHSCPLKSCTYEMTVCLGLQAPGQCAFAKHSFALPHALPDRIGSYYKADAPLVISFPFHRLTGPNGFGLLQISAKATGTNFTVFFEHKLVKLQRGHPQRIGIKSDSLTYLDIEVTPECLEGFVGPDCSVRCHAEPGAHFDCTDKGPVCHAGWSGPRCTQPVCAQGCGSRGQCVGPNECSCSNGWFGARCDQCQPRAGCVHGKCSKLPGTCVCEPNYTGFHCDQVVNMCLNGNPCKNGGVCLSSSVNKFTCSCPKGFSGTECEFNINSYKTLLNLPDDQTPPSHVSITVPENIGFWIFLSAAVLIVGCLVALFVSKRRREKPSGESRAGRRQSEIELDSLEEGRSKNAVPADGPPPYSKIDPCMPSPVLAVPTPPSYEKTMYGNPFSERSPETEALAAIEAATCWPTATTPSACVRASPPESRRASLSAKESFPVPCKQ